MIRSRRNRRLTAAVSFLVLAGCSTPAPSAAEPPLDSIRLPEGFRIDVYASGVPDARSMARSPSGVVYVGSRRAGNVYAVVDKDGDHRAERVVTIASGLNSPNGVAFREGSLYVAEISRVLRFDGIDEKLDDPPEPVVVTDGYPSDRHHGWKYIAFGPDGWLYVPVGAPCNICKSKDPIYASITRIRPDGPNPGQTREIYAHGVRNTVGFTWHPRTGELWFTDNGRDMLGNDVPPDELNRAPEKGLHFGYPYCHGGDISDPEFGVDRGGRGESERACARYRPPVQKLGPHVAALGLEFYTGEMFPAEYRGQLFIAEHGSWNRDDPIGYRVTLVRLDGDRATSYEPFASGWLPGDDEGAAWGRPVDLEILPDGSMLVSDDHAGAIYRITYE
jgi:glucose/arabinose dehydrogenase